MLIDTHCHINMMVKKKFDVPLTQKDISPATHIINEAAQDEVTHIINVGTSLIESQNCVMLATQFDTVFATIGLHPNDCTEQWRDDFNEIKKMVTNKEGNKIVGIGECGIDRHYPEYNLQRQIDAFKAQIELALEHDLALVVHSRDAADETLGVLEEYRNDIQRGVMHCFSYDQPIADHVIAMGFVLGIGGTLTYPKNNELRTVSQTVNIKNIVLETDAPFLPPQIIRGKQNHPKYIKTVATFLAELRSTSYKEIAQVTTDNALNLFSIAI